MIYHKFKPLNIFFLEKVQMAVINELKLRSEDKVVFNHMGFLSEPIKILNPFFKSLGLPGLKSCILFSRPGGEPQPIHLDCSSDDNLTPINCAVNFPIENCDDSYMMWYRGQYNLAARELPSTDGIKRKYVDLEWLTPPELIEKTIIDRPTLVNVSIPHQVNTVPRHRKLLTCRFYDNPSYQSVFDILSKNNLLA